MYLLIRLSVLGPWVWRARTGTDVLKEDLGLEKEGVGFMVEGRRERSGIWKIEARDMRVGESFIATTVGELNPRRLIGMT